ncbi:hypothetical protein ACFL1Q_01780 [Patescibacteria group bacterium]
MKRELLIHIAFLVSFFIFVTIFKGWFSLAYWPFWLGGLVGTFLPDVDHVLYVLMLKPYELTSQRISYLLERKELKKIVELLYETRSERRGLIFHTAGFQMLFLVLTFWMVTSSGSLFGRGLVLAFSLHLLIDQIMDLNDIGSMANWNTVSLVDLTDRKKASLYWLAAVIALCVFGFLM